VETPIFPPREAAPDYLIVATDGLGRRQRRPVIPVARVKAVDQTTRIVSFYGRIRELEHLPEYLPLADRQRKLGRRSRTGGS
jgi:hypothetical protein